VVLKKIIQERMVAKQGRSTGTAHQREWHANRRGVKPAAERATRKRQRRVLRHGGGRRSRPLHPPVSNREDENNKEQGQM